MAITTANTMMTMTTNEQQAFFRKAVRVRSLADPLGAMGFRAPSQRLRREARIRRLAFAATTLGFAGVLAAVISSGPAQTHSSPSLVSAGADGQVTHVTAAPAQAIQNQPPATHTRTKAS